MPSPAIRCSTCCRPSFQEVEKSAGNTPLNLEGKRVCAPDDAWHGSTRESFDAARLQRSRKSSSATLANDAIGKYCFVRSSINCLTLSSGFSPASGAVPRHQVRKPASVSRRESQVANAWSASMWSMTSVSRLSESDSPPDCGKKGGAKMVVCWAIRCLCGPTSRARSRSRSNRSNFHPNSCATMLKAASFSEAFIASVHTNTKTSGLC